MRDKITLDKCLWEQLDQKQVIKFRTGQKGMEAMYQAARFIAVVQPKLDDAEKLLNQGVITQQEYQSLASLLRSPDEECFELASAILTEKKKSHGKPSSTIYFRRPQIQKHRSKR